MRAETPSACLAEAEATLRRGDVATARAAALRGLDAGVADGATVAAALRLVGALRRRGDLAAALAVADALVTAAPREPMARIARSQVAHAMGALDRAIEDTREAMAMAANAAAGRARLVDLLYEAGDLEDAAAEADALLAARPNDIDALAKRADIADAAADPALAGRLLDRALAVRRSTGVGSPALLMALLRAARLDDALPDLDRRWQVSGAPPRPFAGPAWDGRALPGRALLVWGEQGLGEEIRAAALLPRAAERVGRLVVECAPRLCTLFARSFPDARVVARRDPPAPETVAADVAAHTAAVGMLRALGLETVSARPHPPHLRADPATVAACRARYRALGDGPLIGLSWRSANRRVPRAKTADLAGWRPILDRRAVLIDLQYGETGEERAAAAAAGVAIHRDPAVDPLGDLDPVAAQIAALDMVVTVSNTTAHLAGGLGVASTVLLPRGRGQVWCWLDGSRAWYSRMHLCRQARAGDWTSAIAAAAAHLDESLP